MSKNIRLKVAFIVLGTAFLVSIITVLFTIPIIRWSWEALYNRTWFLMVVATIGIAIGTIRIMKRLQPIEEFRKRLAGGESVDKDIFDRAQHIALVFPISSAIIAPAIFLAGGIYIIVGMRTRFHASFDQLALTLLTVLAMGFFLAIFCFYLVKRALRPVVERLMLENPDFLNITPPVRLHIRSKLIISFISLGVLMALFALLGNTYITDTVRNSVGNAELASSIILTIRFVLVCEVVASLVTAIVIGILSAGDLSHPLRRISQSAEEISHGEGRQRISTMTEDEVGELTSSINRMSFGLLENMGQALQKSETLLTALREATDALRNHSWELSSISSEQADGATQQSVSVQEASSTSFEISQSSRQIAAGAQKVHELAEKAQQSCNWGESSLENTLEDIRASREHAVNATQVIRQMEDRSIEIQAVVDIIEEISTQINLLSVNAALEAVGAGAAGKRFKTVAQEVGRLADKTAEAIERIRKTIVETAEHTKNAVEVVRKSAELAIAGAQKAATLEESFDLIKKSIGGTASAAKEIELATNQQATAGDQMADVITGIADSAGILEQNAQRLKVNVENLAMLTDRLREMAAGDK